MKTISIAFDTDGVLRCNCTDVCRDANLRMVELFNILQDFQNVELYVWSGAGKDYAAQFAKLYRLNVPERNCLSKIGAPKMDIAIDDVATTELGEYNLIVKVGNNV
jgi:hypothetical protein